MEFQINWLCRDKAKSESLLLKLALWLSSIYMVFGYALDNQEPHSTHFQLHPNMSQKAECDDEKTVMMSKRCGRTEGLCKWQSLL